MARAAVSKRLTTKPKANKPRLTRTAVKSIDDKYYGPEPIDISSKGFGDALNWYNYMFDHEQAREWMFEYLKRNEYSKTDIASVKRLPKYMITKTACTIARIIMNGNVLEDIIVERFRSSIDEYIAKGRTMKKEVSSLREEKALPSIHERTQNKIKLLITDCEEAIDLDPALNIYDWMKGKEASIQAASAIRDYYAKWISDYEPDELDTKAEKIARAQQKKYWESFLADCDRYCGNKKATKVRKPREKKTKSAVDLVSKLKFQKEFPPLKIVSVNPAELVGCQQLWTYNTKSRKLARYDAVGPNGIQVKGASLVGFDVDKASQKTLRKPEVTIQALLSAGKISLRKFLEEIKTNETKPRSRINSDTVLLRVIK